MSEAEDGFGDAGNAVVDRRRSADATCSAGGGLDRRFCRIIDARLVALEGNSDGETAGSATPSAAAATLTARATRAPRAMQSTVAVPSPVRAYLSCRTAAAGAAAGGV